MTEPSSQSARAELQAWYLESLLPKLARAAQAGEVDPAAADALDAAVCSFLDLTRPAVQEAA